eukprot:963838-Pyramimonas_sp.AAC.1
MGIHIVVHDRSTKALTSSWQQLSVDPCLRKHAEDLNNFVVVDLGSTASDFLHKQTWVDETLDDYLGMYCYGQKNGSTRTAFLMCESLYACEDDSEKEIRPGAHALSGQVRECV